MSTQSKDDILVLGETFVMLLRSPICPPEVRTAIVHYLDQVRMQLDMTNPDLVMSVFNFLAASLKSPVTEAITNAQGQAITSVFAVAAKTGELPNLSTLLPTGESPSPEPKVMVATAAAPTTAQPVTQPVPVVVPITIDPISTTGHNLASRLVEDHD